MLAQMLAPAAALICWSLLVMFWMVQSRLTGIARVRLDLSTAKPGGRGQDLEGVLPDVTNWKAHNYTHLMEQPTIFYPAVLVLAVMGASVWDVRLAWAYVALRIVHSLWQATVNRVPVRASLFFLSSFCLIALAVRALMATLFAQPEAIV